MLRSGETKEKRVQVDGGTLDLTQTRPASNLRVKRVSVMIRKMVWGIAPRGEESDLNATTGSDGSRAGRHNQCSVFCSSALLGHPPRGRGGSGRPTRRATAHHQASPRKSDAVAATRDTVGRCRASGAGRGGLGNVGRRRAMMDARCQDSAIRSRMSVSVLER